MFYEEVLKQAVLSILAYVDLLFLPSSNLYTMLSGVCSLRIVKIQQSFVIKNL